jgi:hypothetical protein
MSLAEIEKAVDALSPEDLAKLADYIARHDKLAWIKKSSAIFPPTANARTPSKESMLKSKPAISRRCRNFAGSSVLLEVLSRPASTHSKSPVVRGQLSH